MPWVHEGHPKMFVDSTLFSSQLDSVSVKHTALSLVAVILKRALKTIEHCLNKEAWQESGVYTATMMEDFVQLFREALSKVGPEPGMASPYRWHSSWERRARGCRGWG